VSARLRCPFVWLGLPLALIILFTIGPLVILLLGGAVAGALGCNMPIAATAPCLFMGADLSEAMSIAVFFGCLAFWTLPAGTTLLGIWLVVAVVVTLVWLRWRRLA
jgi:hypothetical protein